MKFVRIEDADRTDIERALDEAFAKVVEAFTPLPRAKSERMRITPKLAALIAEKRAEGAGYAQIARDTGLKEVTVRSHCIRKLEGADR